MKTMTETEKETGHQLYIFIKKKQQFTWQNAGQHCFTHACRHDMLTVQLQA